MLLDDVLVRELSSGDVRSALELSARLDLLERNPNLIVGGYVAPGVTLRVSRQCSGANRALEVSPQRRVWGLTDGGGSPRCARQTGLTYLCCLVTENANEARSTAAWDEVDAFVRELRFATGQR
jgi:hypothetical protein